MKQRSKKFQHREQDQPNKGFERSSQLYLIDPGELGREPYIL